MKGNYIHKRSREKVFVTHVLNNTVYYMESDLTPKYKAMGSFIKQFEKA